MNEKTKPFRDQHEKLVGIIVEISGFLDDIDMIKENSNKISRLISELKRSLKVHLALEDNSLYPVLLIAEDETVKNKAVEFKEEMGSIDNTFQEYISRWSSGFRIQENPSDFVNESKILFDSLGKRIEKENNNLYVIIDEMFR